MCVWKSGLAACACVFVCGRVRARALGVCAPVGGRGADALAYALCHTSVPRGSSAGMRASIISHAAVWTLPPVGSEAGQGKAGG